MKTAKRFVFCFVGLIALVQWFGQSPEVAAATPPSCNVRSGSGCGTAPKAAAGAALNTRTGLDHWKFNIFGSNNNNQFTWLFMQNPFDITLDTTTNSFMDSVMEMTLTVVDTFQITVLRHPTGLLIKSFDLKTVAHDRDMVKLIAQHRILNIFRQLDSIDTSDSRKLVFRAGTWTLSFDRIPLTDPTDGQEWNSATLPLEVRLLDIVPETYFVDGHFENLFLTPDSRTPIRVYITQTSDSSINVFLQTANNAFVYRIYYQPQDGWVKRIDQVIATQVDVNSQDYAVERKIVDIISKVQQLSFEHKNLIQFITNNGNTRVSFSGSNQNNVDHNSNLNYPEHSPQLYIGPYFHNWNYGQRRLFVIQQDGCTDSIQPLVPWGGWQTPGVFMTVAIERTSRNHLALTIIGVNTSPFDIDFDEYTGAIHGIIARPTTNINAEAPFFEAETLVPRALAASVRLVITDNDGIAFLNPSGGSTLTLVQLSTDQRPALPRIYDLKPETYMMNGNFESLFSYGNSRNIPFTLTLQEDVPGVGQFLLHGVNDIIFEVTWQPEDGWVKSVWPGARTYFNEPYDLIEAEKKIVNLLSNVQQLAFEKDGLLQIITNNNQNRVALMQEQAKGRRLMADSSSLKFSQFLIDPNSYMHQGQLKSLFGSTVFPVIVYVRHLEFGHISLIVEGANAMPYDIYYDEASGLVSQVVPGTAIIAGIQSPHYITEVERRLHDLLMQCHSIVFLGDGIKFNTLDGGIVTRGLTVGDYTIMPQTYLRDGIYEQLSIDPRFPITLTLAQDDQGNAKALLKAVNVIDYYIRFQHHDGWVLQRQEIGQTARSLTHDQRETEDKLKSLFQNVQQLAFEKDGVLQIITNQGRTRVSFKGANHAWWDNPFQPHIPELSNPSGSLMPSLPHFQPNYPPSFPTSSMHPEILTGPAKHVAAGSYRKNGRADPLFTGREFPIQMFMRQTYGGYAEITLDAINRIVYGIDFQIHDGWVVKKRLLVETHKNTPYEEQQTESKLKYIFDHLEQIAFETNGQIQFIADNGQTRISFV